MKFSFFVIASAFVISAAEDHQPSLLRGSNKDEQAAAALGEAKDLIASDKQGVSIEASEGFSCCKQRDRCSNWCDGLCDAEHWCVWTTCIVTSWMGDCCEPDNVGTYWAFAGCV
ncbi:hypothetical protein ACHAWF_015958 [Thalassiosira exigua]